MTEAAPTSPSPKRLSFARLAVAVACGIVAVSVPTLLTTKPLRSVLVTDRVDECERHLDGESTFSRDILEREARQFGENVRAILLCLAGAILSVPVIARVRVRNSIAAVPGADLLFGLGAIAAAATFTGQVRRAADGYSIGLFTESEEARERRAFDIALEPSRYVAASTPSDARIVVIDFPAPHVFQKFGYLVHPRKVFKPPRAEFRFSAKHVREILREMPHGIDWCFDAGYTHVVDLTTLLRTGDPDAIIDLSTLPR